MDELNWQAMSLEFQFDYDDANRQTVTTAAPGYVYRTRRWTLRIIELLPLEGDFARPPLLLSLAPIVIDQEDSYFPVIIQQLRWKSREIAIRQQSGGSAGRATCPISRITFASVWLAGMQCSWR